MGMVLHSRMMQCVTGSQSSRDRPPLPHGWLQMQMQLESVQLSPLVYFGAFLRCRALRVSTTSCETIHLT